MEIYAKCKYDYESVKELIHATMYRFIKPKTAFITTWIMGIMLILFTIIEGVLWEIEMILIILVLVEVFVIGMTTFFYWGLPKLQYNSMDKMQNLENEYIFCDEVIKVSSKSETYSGEAEIKYSSIPRVIETSRYLMIFQSNNQAFTVDKSTITNGSMDDIREKLTQYVKKKYSVRRF